METREIFAMVKSAFCGLITFKERGNTIEIITPFATLNNKFISVFIVEQNGKLIVSDGGWISKEYYNSIIDDESEDILNRILLEYQSYFDVRNQKFNNWSYYFKICDIPEMLPSHAFDLANFISAIVNSREVKYKDEKESKEREKFRANANDFLTVHFKNNVSFRKGLDDYPNIRYNAIVERNSHLYLFSYVTGSTNYYFENELRKSIVNFEIADKSVFKSTIREKIALINDQAEGFNKDRSGAMLDLLEERSSRNITWTDKERVLEIVSN